VDDTTGSSPTPVDIHRRAAIGALYDVQAELVPCGGGQVVTRWRTCCRAGLFARGEEVHTRDRGQAVEP